MRWRYEELLTSMESSHLQQGRKEAMRRAVRRLLHSATQGAFRRWAAWAHMRGVAETLTNAREAAMMTAQQAEALASHESASHAMVEAAEAARRLEAEHAAAQAELDAEPLAEGHTKGSHTKL